MGHAIVEQLDERNRQEAVDFLQRHEETSQFLLNNLSEHGPRLTDHHNSGNFKLIREGGEVRGVICLSRRGNLLAQAEADFSGPVLGACATETVPLRGFIGDWETIEPIWRKFREANPEYRASYESKEILYSYDLRAGDPQLQHDPRVRFLETRDFDQWEVFSDAYMAELNIPNDLNKEARRRDYEARLKERVWWGLFDGDRLLSRAALNSNGKEIGQVGGVFTPRGERKQGFSKATMLHMLKDCRDIHGHRKSNLFTGEIDIPAQKLYESIGYRRIGSFALILG